MNDKLSLTELQLIIKDSLYTALPGFYWVTAEITEIKENYSGHCYLELAEKHPDEVNIRAKARGIIWSNRFRFIRPLFESVTGESLRSGLKILIRVKIEYHEVYGLSLVINDIDPAFTLGEMALKRQQIIRKLEEEGVFTMNKELEFPLLPKRIAVISSGTAAGYTDFMKHLTGNRNGYVFRTTLFEAVMQGPETEKSMTGAFERISRNTGLFDVIVIVRGGGSQSDLSWFDNYTIAYYVTQLPVPVITGIGHDKDMSVTDMVAHRAEKTPTAVADFLAGSMQNTEELLIQMGSSISSIALDIIGETYRRIDSARLRLVPIARMMVASEKGRVAEKIISLVNIGKDYIVRVEHTPSRLAGRLIASTRAYTGKLVSDLNAFSTSLNQLSPVNVLKRGYTITSVNGRPISSADSVEIGEIIDTHFSDGVIKSRVEQTGKKKR